MTDPALVRPGNRPHLRFQEEDVDSRHGGGRSGHRRRDGRSRRGRSRGGGGAEQMPSAVLSMTKREGYSGNWEGGRAMACMKLGSKADGFQKRGQAWFCYTTGLESDVVIEVGVSFHLHKFPLLSKSGRLARLIAESSNAETGECRIHMEDIPGGTDAFELAAKFCYGVKLELTSGNVAALRCAAEYLEMTEDFGEDNLLARTESFLNGTVLRSWKETVRVLKTCEALMPEAETLNIVKRCVDSLSGTACACADPSLFGWPMMEQHGALQSPGGSVLWNGISTGARGCNSRSDWWYDEAASLCLPMYVRVITAMGDRGVRPESIAGSIMHYAKKALPGLHRRQGGRGDARAIVSPGLAATEADQRALLETIEDLLPLQKGVVASRFLFGLLRTAMILNASADCKAKLERRIGLQLDQSSLDDLLVPNYYSVDTLYDVDCVQRILDHYILLDQAAGGAGGGALSPRSVEDDDALGSPPPASLSPMMLVSKLVDNYLAEVAPDVNFKPAKFQALAEALPEYSRLSDDGLYRAIDIYLKAHPWLSEPERERLCRIMDCQKLSLEACTHAAQNERLPLRVVVQVLFFEQLQLRTAIASAFMVTDTVDSSHPLIQHRADGGSAAPHHAHHHAHHQGGAAGLRGDGGWANVVRENQVLKVDMDKMRTRVSELEKECTVMRQELHRLGGGGGGDGNAGGGAGGATRAANAFDLVCRKLGCRTSRSEVSVPPQPPPLRGAAAVDTLDSDLEVDDGEEVAAPESVPLRHRRHARRRFPPT